MIAPKLARGYEANQAAVALDIAQQQQQEEQESESTT